MQTVLIIVTGTEGAGKSSILPYLVSPRWQLIDFDNALRPWDGSDQWYGQTLRVCLEKAGKAEHAVIVGLIYPRTLRHIPREDVLFILLELTQAERARRLTKRNDSEGLITDSSTAETLREQLRGLEYIAVDVTNGLSDNIGKKIVEIIEKAIE